MSNRSNRRGRPGPSLRRRSPLSDLAAALVVAGLIFGLALKLAALGNG